MTVYYGVTRDNKIILPDDLHLPDGIPVEVRPNLTDASDDSVAVDEELRAAGLFANIPVKEALDDATFEPVPFTGRPVSEHIIEERR